MATAPDPPPSASGVPVARPIPLWGRNGDTSEKITPILPKRGNRLAVTSVVFGAVPIIPILSQIVGVIMGLVALRRISQARRAGIDLPGRGCAWAGISLNIISLVGWILTLVLGSFVASQMSSSLNALRGIRIPAP